MTQPMRHPLTPAASWTRLSSWLAAFFLVLALTGAEPSSRTVVGTRFEIQARAFAENLGDRRPALEAEVAAALADQCEAELSYVDWQPLTNAPSSMDPPWILKGTMNSEGSSAIPAVVLRFERFVAGQAPALLVREPLYLANDLDQPTQDEARLRDELLNRVRTLFDNAEQLLRLQRKFLVVVPIARQLVPDPVNQRILLPARWSELLPGLGSQLSAQYRAARAADQVVPVLMVLSPSADWSGQVGCTVTRFDYPPLLLNQPAWDPAMPESLSNAVPDTLFVFMDQYVKDYRYGTTTNRLVLEPFTAARDGGVR